MPHRGQRLQRYIEMHTKVIAQMTITFIVRAATLPYYRGFQFNTMDPIMRMAAASQSGQTSVLVKLTSRWRSRKLMELQYISLASTVLAAAVIGSFSWFSVPDAYWLALALWYSSLIFSILAIVLSAQQMAVLSLLGDLPERITSPAAMKTLERYLPLMLSRQPPQDIETESKTRKVGTGVWKPRWKMVFTWQCSTMFMSYSLILFLSGLTILVCSPLIDGGPWNSSKNVAIVYLVVAAIAGLCFVTCSFWVFHYVDLEYDSATPEEDDETSAREIPQPSSGGLHTLPISNRANDDTSNIRRASRRELEET